MHAAQRTRHAERRGIAAGRRGGSALVIVLLALLLVSALGAAMVALSTSETLAASNQRDARAILYAAEAAVELAAAELVRIPNWDDVLTGAARSVRSDGPPPGGRALPDGGIVFPEALASLANCGSPSPCTPAQLADVTDARPWGADNPAWQVFYSGRSGGGGPSLPVYCVVLVADDPQESDGDPERDSPSGSPGAGVLTLRALSFGPAGSRGLVQATVERLVTPSGLLAPRFLAWSPAR
jgi:hypothetical protein